MKNKGERKNWYESYVDKYSESTNEDIIAFNSGLWINIGNSLWFKDSEELMYFIKYAITDRVVMYGTRESRFVDVTEAMVDEMREEKKAKYVMDAAMHMIHGMGLKIVSEGIETGEQFGRMNELGIAYIQGFYFSKPLERMDFIKFLVENNGQKVSEI